MEAMLRELRFAGRALRRDPGFSAAAVATLALGIGATTAIFSVVHGVLLAPLPYPDGEQLVRLYSTNARQGIERGLLSGPDLVDFGEAGSMAAISPVVPFENTLEDGEGNAIRVAGYVVSSGFFDVFGTRMAAGRAFLPEEEAPNSPIEVVLSHRLWHAAFDGDPSIVGGSVSTGGTILTVVGVAPPELRYPRDAALWILAGLPWADMARRGRSMPVVGRLARGVSLEAAGGELDLIASRLEREHAQWNADWGVQAVPLKESIVGDVRPGLLALMLASAGLLLVAVVNVANLFLARGAARIQETALRSALGASRRRMAGSLLAEAFLVISAGAVGGVLLAVGALSLFDRLAPFQLALLGEVGFGWQVAAFAGAITSGAVLTFSAVPVLRTATVDLRALLAGGGRRSTAAGGARLRAGLVVAEVAVATALVIGSGLLIKSFRTVTAVDPGFVLRDALRFNLLPQIDLYGPDDLAAFYESLLQELSSAPGVRGVAAMGTLPLSTEYDVFRPVRIMDLPEPETGQAPQTYVRPVTAGFFDVMGIPLEEGRAFTDLDVRESAGVAVVNRAFVRRHLADGRALNRTVHLYSTNFGALGHVLNDDVEIVGVAGDVRYTALTEEAPPAIYLPHTQAPFRRMTLVLAGHAGDPTALLPAAREGVATLDDRLAMSGVGTLEDVIDAATASERFTATLLGAFGLMALVVAMVGIYGVISHQVARRLPEMAVRMSIGASPGAVVRLILRSGARVWGPGIALGVVGALALQRVLVNQLYGVSATDPEIFAGAACVLAVVSLAATSVPALRSIRIAPADTLRDA